MPPVLVTPFSNHGSSGNSVTVPLFTFSVIWRSAKIEGISFTMARRRGLWLWSFLPALLALSISRLVFCQSDSSFKEFYDGGEEDEEEYEEYYEDGVYDAAYEEHQHQQPEEYGLHAMEFVFDEEGSHGVRFQDHNGVDHVVPIPPHLLDLPEDQILGETMLLARTLYQLPIVGHDEQLMESQGYIHPSDRRQRERIILTLFFHAIKGSTRMKQEGHWLDENYHYCDWAGVSCGVRKDADYDFVDADASPVPDDIVTRIEISREQLSGTLPTEISMLEHLQMYVS
jgi:hypothetical protein